MRLHSRNLTSIAMLLMAAVSLRLLGILSRPIWYDEAFAILFSQKGLASMLEGTMTASPYGAADIHPLGYYTLLWMWIGLAGNSIPAARILSIFSNLISILLLYLLLRDLFDKKSAYCGAFAASILPFQVHFAQEIRMYSTLSMWLILAVYAYFKGRTGKWQWWIVYTVSSALAQYTHNLAVVFLIVLAITPVLERKLRILRSTLLASSAAILLYLPWGIHLPSQLAKIGSFYWVARPGLDRIFSLFLYYVTSLPLQDKFLIPGLFVSTVVITLSIFYGIKSFIKDAPGGFGAAWLLYLAFSPPALLWLISQFFPVYIERALLPSHLAFCGWVGWVLVHSQPSRLIRNTILSLIILASINGVYHHVTYQGFPYYPGAIIGRELSSRIQSSDLVLHSRKLSYLPSLLESPGLNQGFIIDPPQSNVDTLAPATRKVLGLVEFTDIRSASRNVNRVWFVIYQKSIEETVHQGYKTHPHLEYLGRNFSLVSVYTYGEVKIFLYSRLN